MACEAGANEARQPGHAAAFPGRGAKWLDEFDQEAQEEKTIVKNRNLAVVSLGLLCFVAAAYAQDANKEDAMRNCPMHKEHVTADSHEASVDKHGDQAMGFPHDKTTHHFRMSTDGGAIEVTANDANDKANAEAIRSHLSHIAVMFADGNFSTPMFAHDGVPPGVTTMKLLKNKIRYKYEEISSGGRVRIESSDPIALAAIHDFLRFQITEHQTGDALVTAESD